MRNVYLLTAVFLACFWGFFAYWAVWHRQETITATEGTLTQLAHAVEQYTRHVIKMAEIFQVTAERWLQDNEGVDPRADPGFVALIEDFRSRTGGLIDIRMISAGGDLYYFPGTPGRPLDNVADREYFQAALRAQPGDRFFGVPVVSRVTGQWRLPITTRMAAGQHGFAVTNASVDLSALIETFESERPKPRGSISLWRGDGTLLARAPMVDAAIGKPLAKGQQLEMITRQASGVFRSAATPVDGAERFVAHKRLGDLPLFIVVTATLDDALEPWRRQVIMVSIALVFISVWGTLVSGQLVAALRQIAASTRELERLATVDALTGLYNRRYLIEAGEHELARMQRYGSPMALLLLDVDNFKEINDTRGHPIGDRALQGLAQAMRGCVRDQDTVARLGGEEFAAILPETDGEGAVAIAQRMLAAIASATLATDDEDRPVQATVSIGVTALNPENDSFESALARADRALYRAKENGRNRVEVG